MKGQYFSFDAIIASVIFVLALVALLSYWHSVRSFLEYQNDPITKEAIRISNLLFVPPSPSDCASMKSFGLAVSFEDRRVNASTINCIDGKDEAWLQSALGTSYNISIQVKDLSESNTRPTVLLGGVVPAASDPSAPSNVVKMRRLSSVVDKDGSTYIAAFDLSIYK
jgi:hypothetical protein